MYHVYSFPYSQHSRRVIALLEIANLPYENHTVDMLNGEHLTDAFLRINPNHQVPVLIDDQTCVYESNAILRYLCRKHELTNWYPQHLDELAKVEQWLDWNQCQLSPLVVDLVLNAVFLGEHGNPQAIAQAKEKLPQKILQLEQHFSEQPYLAGTKPIIADLSLASNCFQLSLADALPSTTHIQTWYHKMLALPGFQQALPQAS